MGVKHYKITETWYQKVDGSDTLEINLRERWPSIMGGSDKDPTGPRLGKEISQEEFKNVLGKSIDLLLQ
jgi:hypothetical protein